MNQRQHGPSSGTLIVYQGGGPLLIFKGERENRRFSRLNLKRIRSADSRFKEEKVDSDSRRGAPKNFAAPNAREDEAAARADAALIKGWVESRLSISRRQVYRYIDVFENIGPEKCATLVTLSKRALFETAAAGTPESVRAEVDRLVAAGELIEISENLHRADLTPLDRSDQTTEWFALIDEKNKKLAAAAGKPAQLGRVSGGRGKKGGVSAAARELGVTRQEVERAKKIASIAPEAKAAAAEGAGRRQIRHSAGFEVLRVTRPEDAGAAL